MMRKYLTYILLLGFPLLGAQNKGNQNSDYQKSWTSLEQQNEAVAFDADLTLSDAEKALDHKLSGLRQQIMSDAKDKKIPLYNLSFNEIKPMIESSKLFDVIRSMPKGGLLHTHSGGFTDVKWVIATARKYRECYVYNQKDQGDYIYGQLAFLRKEKYPAVL